MNTILNFSKHLASVGLVFSALNANAQAQKPVESTHVDEKFAYTTVVYKNTTATDKDVLASLENDFGIGDVVRVTLAPPPTPLSAVSASEPVYADKVKGEDIWLEPKAKSTELLSVSTKAAKPVLENITNITSAANSPEVDAVKTQAGKPTVVAKPVVKETSNVTNAITPAPVEVNKMDSAVHSNDAKSSVKSKNTVSRKSAKAHKSSKKSGKKSTGKLKWKSRKHGKQRYSCPSF